MTDLSLTVAPKSDQLNADDLIAGPRIIKITGVSADPGNAEQPIRISFEGDGGKPFRPCKTVRRILIQIWGSDGKAYVGRFLKLYRDPEVTYGGLKVGGIRIAEASDIDGIKTVMTTVSQKKRAPVQVRPLSNPPQSAPAASQEEIDALEAEAEAAAAEGTQAFREWYAKQKPIRTHLKGKRMDALKEKAERADQAKAANEQDSDDPFEGDDPKPSAEELEKAEREALERADREAMAAMGSGG